MSLLCPSCKIDLVMSDRQGVEIDYCPKCRGVWLDRGELDKILERAEGRPGPSPVGATHAVNSSLFGAAVGGAAVAPRPQNPQHVDNDRRHDPRRDYRRRDDDDDDDDDRRKYGHPPRRKSWLSEIFD